MTSKENVHANTSWVELCSGVIPPNLDVAVKKEEVIVIDGGEIMTKPAPNGSSNRAVTRSAATTTASSTTTTAPPSPKKPRTAQSLILAALAQQRASGVEAPCRKLIATMTGIKNEISFKTICARMIKQQLIECPDRTTVKLTDTGMALVAGEMYKLPQTNTDVHAKVKKELAFTTRRKCRKIFDVLADGRDHTVAECAKLVGYNDETNKSFRTYLGCLSQWTETHRRGDGAIMMIRLNDSMFPFGRPVVE